MEKTLEKLMEQTEDCLKQYAKKPEWTPQDLECAYKAACMYDKLQTIKMNNGVWDQIKGDVLGEKRSYGDHSNGYYPGGESFARGRDAMTGRYVSRRNYPLYYDGYVAYGDDASGRSQAGNRMSYGDTEHRSMHSINDQMIQKLEMLMDQAGSEYERQKVRDIIHKIEENK